MEDLGSSVFGGTQVLPFWEDFTEKTDLEKLEENLKDKIDDVKDKIEDVKDLNGSN